MSGLLRNNQFVCLLVCLDDIVTRTQMLCRILQGLGRSYQQVIYNPSVLIEKRELERMSGEVLDGYHSRGGIG